MSNYISNSVTIDTITRCLNYSTDAYQNSLEQLSSGCKFTSISEDIPASSKAIKLDIQINANKSIMSNISIGSDMLSTAESYQENIIGNIQRINDLTLQASAGTYATEDMNNILLEINERLSQINYMATNSNFNGVNLMDGSNTDIRLYIGTSDTDFINIGSNFVDCHAGEDALDIDLEGVTAANWTQAQRDEYLDRLSNAVDYLTANCTQIAANISQIEVASDNLTVKNQNLTEYKSEVSDTDVAKASAESIQFQIMQQIATSIFTQANQEHQLAYSLLQQ